MPSMRIDADFLQQTDKAHRNPKTIHHEKVVARDCSRVCMHETNNNSSMSAGRGPSTSSALSSPHTCNMHIMNPKNKIGSRVDFQANGPLPTPTAITPPNPSRKRIIGEEYGHQNMSWRHIQRAKIIPTCTMFVANTCTKMQKLGWSESTGKRCIYECMCAFGPIQSLSLVTQPSQIIHHGVGPV